MTDFSVAREPSGRRQRQNDRAASEVRRLREMAWRGLRDSEWGTEIGRLYLEGKITAAHYAAGKRWGKEAAAYQNAIGAFPIKSGGLENGRVTPPDPDSDAGQQIAKREREAIEAFFEAHFVLALCGAERIVRDLVEHDRSVGGWQSLLLARRGLAKLSQFYALTNQRKSGANGKSLP